MPKPSCRCESICSILKSFAWPEKNQRNIESSLTIAEATANNLPPALCPGTTDGICRCSVGEIQVHHQAYRPPTVDCTPIHALVTELEPFNVVVSKPTRHVCHHTSSQEVQKRVHPLLCKAGKLNPSLPTSWCKIALCTEIVSLRLFRAYNVSAA